MPDKSEKEQRKQILNDLRLKASEVFDKALPMTKDLFKSLFDYLDKELSDKECDDKPTLTRTFLTHKQLSNQDVILNWLADKGGYCDCEILANVEEQFGNI